VESVRNWQMFQRCLLPPSSLRWLYKAQHPTWQSSSYSSPWKSGTSSKGKHVCSEKFLNLTVQETGVICYIVEFKVIGTKFMDHYTGYIDMHFRRCLISVVLFFLFFFLTRIRPQWPITVSVQRLRCLQGIFCLSDDRSSCVEEYDSGPFFALVVSSYSCIGICVLALN
jgi:hypothetical protein